MKTLWILLAFIGFIGFTLPEQLLDRTYLPPPGSKFSGGSPGENDVPLEFPKETYSSSSQDNNFGQPEIAIGIYRVGSNISPEKYGDITSTVPSFHGNSYGFPTTTTSYALSQPTSYVPAADSTNAPEMSITSKYYFNSPVINLTPSFFREKNLSFDHDQTKPNNVYNAVEGKHMFNDINNIVENQLPSNIIIPQVVTKTSDESVYSNNGDVNGLSENNLQSGDLSTPGITSTPTKMDHSLLNNNYNTNHSPQLSESIMEQDVNLISSTPRPSDNLHYNSPSQYVSASQIGITNSPYSYRMRPERIQVQDREAVILNYDNTIIPDGYAYSFDTSNGIHADEKGIAISGVRAAGSYSYIGDDGQLYSVNYTADENGFRAQGAHLPTAPPIPDAIMKVIEQAAVDKANGIYDDGSYDESKYGYQKYNPTKNIRFLNQYNKDREGAKLTSSQSNNQLPHYNRLDKNINIDNDTDKENKQNVITKNTLQPFIIKELLNESVSEMLPIYKSGNVVNIGKDHFDIGNNGYNNKLKNELLNSIPHLKHTEKDRMMNIEFYDETGYHYSKPQNNYSLKAANKYINKFLDTSTLAKIPAIYKQTMENTPVSNQPFMTPYVPQNDDISVEHDGDDQYLNIPAKYHEEENVILSNQHQNTSIFPTSAETKRLPGQTENRIIHNFNNQFKLPDTSFSDDQGYLYIKNDNSNNDSYVPFITSTETGLSDITSTTPTAFPQDNSKISTKHSEISLIQNQAASSNPSLDYEKYRGSLTNSNKLDHYGNINNDDFTDADSRYNIPNTHAADTDHIIDQSTAKTYSEDFSGPKQAQKYDPLTGYHY